METLLSSVPRGKAQTIAQVGRRGFRELPQSSLQRWTSIQLIKSNWFHLQNAFEIHFLNSIATVKFTSPKFLFGLGIMASELLFLLSFLAKLFSIQATSYLKKPKQNKKTTQHIKHEIKSHHFTAWNLCRGYLVYLEENPNCSLTMALNSQILLRVHGAPGALISFLYTGQLSEPQGHHTHHFLYHRERYLFLPLLTTTHFFRFQLKC